MPKAELTDTSASGSTSLIMARISRTHLTATAFANALRSSDSKRAISLAGKIGFG